MPEIKLNEAIRRALAPVLAGWERKIIWIHGPRASGKTVLAAYLCSSAMRRDSSAPPVTITAHHTTQAGLRRILCGAGPVVLDEYEPLTNLPVSLGSPLDAELRAWHDRSTVFRGTLNADRPFPAQQYHAPLLIVCAEGEPKDAAVRARTLGLRCRLGWFTRRVKAPTLAWNSPSRSGQ